jgi:hypothetical protein
VPGTLLHVGATVLCAHGGQATPMSPNPRVLVGGQPTVTQPTPEVVAGCGLPPNLGGPCVTASWVSGSTRVLSNGLPLLVIGSQAVCAPTGTPLLVVQTQLRVTGT